MLWIIAFAFVIGFIAWMVYESDDCPLVDEETGKVIVYKKITDNPSES